MWVWEYFRVLNENHNKLAVFLIYCFLSTDFRFVNLLKKPKLRNHKVTLCIRFKSQKPENLVEKNFDIKLSPVCKFKNPIFFSVELFQKANCFIPRVDKTYGCCPKILISNSTSSETIIVPSTTPPPINPTLGSNCRTLGNDFT